MRTDASGLVRVEVRRDSVARAAAVLTGLAAAGEQAGLALVKAEGGVAWGYAGQTIAFALIEAADQVEHVATQKELAALESGDVNARNGTSATAIGPIGASPRSPSGSGVTKAG